MAKALEKQSWPYEVYSQSDKEHKPFGYGVKISREDIDGFIQHMLNSGFKPGTVKQYQYCLNRFYEDLVEDKTVYGGKPTAWLSGQARFADHRESENAGAGSVGVKSG